MSENEAQIELEAVLNTLVDGVIIIDEFGSMRLFNPACEDIFGYTSDEVMGKNVKMLMPEPYKADHDGYLEDYQKTHERKIIGIGREVNGLCKDGSVFHMDLAVGETRLNGHPIFVGVIRDLSDQYQQREKYETLQQEHFHLSRVSAMNEMGSAIAHELNQPMTATINYLEAGKFMIDQGQTGDSEKIRNILDSAIDQTKRASDIIARLRKFIETGDMQKEETDLKSSLEMAVDMALLPFKQSAIELVNDISPDLPRVLVNQVQVQQVVVNLIKNACEAMQGSADKKLLISAHIPSGKDFVEICIADSGKGIAEADQKNLFTPFSTEKHGGMGVGLSISRSIIDNHDGRIWAEANEPNGTRFIFTLPLSEPSES
jgi:two-component system sensor kinase FixL